MPTPHATALVHKSIVGYLINPHSGDASLVAALYGTDDLKALPRNERVFGIEGTVLLGWPEIESFVRTIAENMNLSASFTGRTSLRRTLMLWRKRTKPSYPVVCKVDFDTAEYMGDGEAGVYYATAYGRRGNVWGWWLSTTVDGDWGCQDMDTDDGPYKTNEAALLAGRDAAGDWCFTNNIDTGESKDTDDD